ncbi:hypothetical protein BUALT_Bualt16G0085000 [Buddleja alternifolia]|uniref:Response regulatory domain-containing protein n=1 Tax=Buddleja alternifolia TaxID=168488 RepID=A0AAV6WID4_9LAMI|nr:hypothetical protein BUALT_Bualt16G0085000 [Buddleja alternifolia]
MSVEEIRGENENYEQFPAGLRVLVVDDDLICLKVLEKMLRNCHYNVTTTSQARMALKMLRENKDMFDLVISEVHMPDMDGFRLLELVGLEMDLPVIMLSANSDPKNLMKGITHGACDYLVKPFRLEELRNIWQHVIRRKKNPKKSNDQNHAHQASGEGRGSPLPGNIDHNGNFNREMKDGEDESEDNGNESSSGTQTKPRVVWSIELHRKFVAAVNQLGIDSEFSLPQLFRIYVHILHLIIVYFLFIMFFNAEAVPKRILGLMNDNRLTRENKYRLYLRRISSVAATQQANMIASPFMRMGSLDGLRDFRTLAGSGRLGNVGLSPFTTGGMLGRLNSPTDVNLRNLTPSALVQPGQLQNLTNSNPALGRVHPLLSPTSQNSNVFQGMPLGLELDQLQHNKGVSGIPNFNTMDDSRMFITPGTQKNPPVVWSVELHRKFVAAVNQLGIENAVPERILHLMNDNRLTQENVASHLQAINYPSVHMYLLYLKRYSSVAATQQASMVASPFVDTGSLDGFKDFRTLAGVGRLGNVALSPFTTDGILSKLNSPAKTIEKGDYLTILNDKAEDLRNLVGSPIQETRNTNPKKYLVPKHENKAGCAWNNPLLGSRYLALCLPGFQEHQLQYFQPPFIGRSSFRFIQELIEGTGSCGGVQSDGVDIVYDRAPSFLVICYYVMYQFLFLVLFLYFLMYFVL